MSYHRLSQAEIDMLLGEDSSNADGESLSQSELDTVGEIGTTAVNAAATSLFESLGQGVSITNPQVSETSLENYYQEAQSVAYVAHVRFQEGFNTGFYMVFQERDARVIIDMLAGNDGSNPPEEMGEMQLSGLTEIVNQVTGNMMTALSSLFKKKISTDTPEVQRYDFSQLETPIGVTLDDMLAKVEFRFEIGSAIDSTFILLIPTAQAKEFTRAFEAATMPMPAAAPSATRPVETSPPARDNAAVAAAPQPAYQQVAAAQPQVAPAMPMMPTTQSHGGPVMHSAISAQPVQFTPFTPAATPQSPGNLNLILDVPLQVTVELGRAKRQVKEVIELGTGSIIELDKLTGDPVDILINGKAIAEGEVVIIDENFAVRITKIKNIADRIGALQ